MRLDAFGLPAGAILPLEQTLQGVSLKPRLIFRPCLYYKVSSNLHNILNLLWAAPSSDSTPETDEVSANLDSGSECQLVAERSVSIHETFDDPYPMFGIFEKLGFVCLGNHLA
jgi:hypothetical protein